MPTRLSVIGFAVCLLMGFGARSGQAQTTGTIFGTVQDESQSVLPGVTVTVRNADTGLTRPVVSDHEGAYRAPSLPVGNYEIQAELPGFQSSVRKGIVLTLGREAQVDFTLKVGDVVETLVVTGEAPLVETQSVAMSGLVDSEKIRDLPLNARDYVQLATLQPGVTILETGSRMDAGTSSGSVGRGVGVKLSISGARSNANAFQLDGTDVNDYANTTPGSITGSNLGVEAIREFRVLTNTYSAEYGRSAGGVITAVSRSGTNSFHGSLFEFHRNDSLDAPNFFDNALGRQKPDFKRNQYGGAAGGPIVRDKLFFFSNYEGHRETIGITSVASVLTEQARLGNLVSGRVTVHPNIQPVLPLFPLPNGAVQGDIGDFVNSSTADVREDFVVGKIDHQVSDRHNYFVRYTFSDAGAIRPDNLLLNNNEGGSRRQFTTFDWKTVLSSTMLNSLTVAYNRTETFNGLQTSLVDFPNISFVPGRPMGSISVTGMSGFPGGVGAADADFFDYKVMQLRNDVNWTRGRHGMKFGVNLQRLITDMNGSNTPNGTFSFGSIRDFLDNRPDGFRGMGPGSDVIRGFRQNLIGLYIQDDFRLASQLTLSAGVRYEFITDIEEVDGKIGNLVNFSDSQFTQGKFFENPSLKNFAPRLGIAWDPTGHGTTSIRGGVGLFHDQILTHYFSGGFAIQNPPYFRGAALGSEFMVQGDFPSAFDKFVALGTNAAGSWVEWFQYDPKQPYAMQYNVNVQHQLAGDFVVTAGYVGYSGDHFKRISEDGNIRVPVVLPDGRLFFNHAGKTPCPIASCFDSPRRNPNFGGIKTAALDGRASYHALQAGVNKRFRRGLNFQASYTFGKAMDHASGVFNEKDLSNSNLLPNFWYREDTWGLADYDVRHNFIMNYQYEFPIPKMNGAAGAVLNGWGMGGIFRAVTGQPYTPVLGSDQAKSLSFRGAGGQRPSVPEGHSGHVESTGDPAGWFDRTQFIFPEAGFLGNLGRGTGTGDGVVTFDATLTKNTYFTASKYLQFRFELFNALNHANFANPGRPAVFNNRGAINQNAGRITSTSTRNRQIQLSLKFYF